MRRLLSYITIVLSLLWNNNSVNAQQDTIFWFAAPEVSSSEGDNPVYLRFLTYDQPATVTISLPANVGFTPVSLSIPASNLDSINLTPFLSSIESPSADAVNTNGIKITSTASITCFYELMTASNKEIFSLKGNKSLGTNFYTPFQKFWDNASTTPSTFSSIDIVATENGTTVLISPKTDIVGHTANNSYTITLNKGETYSARDVDPSATTSLAGSIISSDKPIALTCFSGALINGGCTSSVGDQITPTDFIGTDYIIQKGKSNDKVFILATQNATTIDIYNTTTSNTLINWSETHELDITDPITYIKTSKPVYVFHVSGNGCNLSGAQIPNVFCSGKYTQTFTRTNSDSLGVMLYVRSGFENQFLLNGSTTLIPSTAFSVVPGTGGNFMAAEIFFSTTDVPVNSYNLIENTGDVFGVAVLEGQTGGGSGYAFLSEFLSYPYVDAGLDDTVCANVPFAVNGLVGGGSVTGYWSSNGFGSFQTATSDLTNIYIPSGLDTIISPIELILTSTGPCPVQRDTLLLMVDPAPIVNASADQSVCANNANVQLSGSVSGGASTGKWTSIGSGVFTPNDSTLNAVYVPSSADVTTGSVKLVLTSTNVTSCNNVSDTMVVTITPAPVVNAGPDTVYVCENNAIVNLSGSVSGGSSTGKWISSGNGVFSPDNLSLTATYTPSSGDIQNGSVRIILESTNNGGCYSVKDTLMVVFTSAPTVEAGANVLACTNEAAVQMNGVVSGPTSTGIWSGGAGAYSPGSSDLNATYTPTASEISSGSLVLTLTSTNNGSCNAVSDAVQLDFVAPPLANFSGNDVCFGETTVFTDFSLNGYGTITDWNWSFGDGSTDTLQDPDYQYTQAGNYSVSLIVTTNVGCQDTLTQNVNVFETPVADFSFTATCNGSVTTVDFFDNASANGDTINYWFYDFGGQGNSTMPNPTNTFIGTGDFVITQIVKTIHNCIDSVVQIVAIPDLPQAGFYYNTDNGLNIGATFNFVDTSLNTTSYYWTFDDGNSSTLQDPTNVYYSNGNYVVTQYVYNSVGCIDSTLELITINTVTTEIKQLIPNAISPNGDGKNDVWKLKFVQLLYPEAEVEIYNRWGQLLFRSVGYTTPWDGTFNGERVPDGTYYYILDLNDPAEPEPYKGTILVLKNQN